MHQQIQFVKKRALKYYTPGLTKAELPDLINGGLFGAYRAARRFDSSRNIPFLVYARGDITQGIVKQLYDANFVSIPKNTWKIIKTVKQSLNECRKQAAISQHPNVPKLLTQLKDLANQLRQLSAKKQDKEIKRSLLDMAINIESVNRDAR